MTMFVDPDGENRLCMRLKTMVEEFGPENVIVEVPKEWEDYSKSSTLGLVLLKFTAACEVKLTAYNGWQARAAQDPSWVYREPLVRAI